MTRAEILAEELHDVIVRAAADTKLQPAALRVEISPILRTDAGYVIPISIKTNQRKIVAYTLTLAEVA